MNSKLSALVAVSLSLSSSLACGPEPEPEPEPCPIAVDVAADGLPIEQASTTSDVPDSSCGSEGEVALFSFTPETSGSFRAIARDGDRIPIASGIWITRDDACEPAVDCEPASSMLLRDLVAGETVFIGARLEDDIISMTIVPVTVGVDGAACDEISRFCAAGSECVDEVCIGDVPFETCADPALAEGEVSTTVTLDTTTAVPTSACGVSTAASTGSVRWTAPRSGVMSYRADDDATRLSVHRRSCDVTELGCAFGAVFRGLRVDAGDTVVFAIESTTASAVRLTFDMLDPVGEGDTCDPDTQDCVASECVADFGSAFGAVDDQSCKLVDPPGTCDAPIPVALDETKRVFADTRPAPRSPCAVDGPPGAAVFSFTAPEDLVLIPDEGARVARDTCTGEELSSLCDQSFVSLRAGETVVIEHRYSSHGVAIALEIGRESVIQFRPHTVAALGVGDACDPDSADDGWCAFGTVCADDVCGLPAE